MNTKDKLLIEPPYYAVIFTSQRTTEDPQGYERTVEKMVFLAKKQQGFLGMESVRDNSGAGITVSYWKDKSAINAWKNQVDHLIAQKNGKLKWYKHYKVQITSVERDYEFVK